MPVLEEKEKVLLLDVRTRWSSTCFMLKRALAFRRAVDDFSVIQVKELKGVCLLEEDWAAIELVATWLEEFADITALMSSTSCVTRWPSCLAPLPQLSRSA
ncbi:hypothetical protein BT69DRAFT_1236656 [Atractiella rhizophila]|nr:hypothetical protein BT69DRAFT_1236656 [Atractiella rhizophila]